METVVLTANDGDYTPSDVSIMVAPAVKVSKEKECSIAAINLTETSPESLDALGRNTTLIGGATKEGHSVPSGVRIEEATCLHHADKATPLRKVPNEDSGTTELKEVPGIIKKVTTNLGKTCTSAADSMKPD